MKLPRTYHNWLSYLGTAVAGMALIVFTAVLALYMLTGRHQPYAGLVLFILIPAIFLTGLALIPVGMFLEWRHEKKTGEWTIARLPIIDFNNARHRNAAFIFSVGALFVALFSGFVSLEAFRYTESPTFCGEVCHTVMRPEYTTYKDSPHARVACVECHVGPGATWYVRSKLSGLHQVLAVLFNTYPRPIPTPISDLRPAQETCEQCHWPKQFWGGDQAEFQHFLSDSSNTPWNITLNVKIGGGNPQAGQTRGIHWHMSIDSRVEYYATDSARQDIEWVRFTDLTTGQATVYTTGGKLIPEDSLPPAEIRTMDCIDCHNRPTHIYDSPNRSLDIALAAGRIDSRLPYIKRTGVKLLAAKYPSVDSALAAIESGVTQFYREGYPELASRRADAITTAVTTLQAIYQRNDFPRMRAWWSVYPENNQHWIFKGCFRCHGGQHESQDGVVVSHDCTTCHTILAQGPAGAQEFSQSPEGLTFRHPIDIGGMWRQVPCDECHSGSG